jgi:hypothetical protein
MTQDANFLSWLDRKLKQFNHELLLADREQRYRSILPNFDSWSASIPAPRRNILCGGACLVFVRELLRRPRAWKLLANLKCVSFRTAPIDPEVAWREFAFDVSGSVVGDPTAWKQSYFVAPKLKSDTHVFLANDRFMICPSTGFIIMASFAEVLEDPTRIRSLYEGSISAQQWINRSLQWVVSPMLGLLLVPAAYRGAKIVMERPALVSSIGNWALAGLLGR